MGTTRSTSNVTEVANAEQSRIAFGANIDDWRSVEKP